jgi:hypothetical protein
MPGAEAVDALQPTHDGIAQQAKAIADAQIVLAALILSVCPGPHRYVQRRDRRPPWCGACGYTSHGLRVSTPGAGRSVDGRS